MLNDLIASVRYSTLGRIVASVVALVLFAGILFATGLVGQGGGEDPARPDAVGLVTTTTSITLLDDGAPRVTRDAAGRIIITNRAIEEMVADAPPLPQTCEEAQTVLSGIIDLTVSQTNATPEQELEFQVIRQIATEICSYRSFLAFEVDKGAPWYTARPVDTPENSEDAPGNDGAPRDATSDDGGAESPAGGPAAPGN